MAKKRIFSIMLAMSMVLSLLPATVFAAEGEETQYPEDSNQIEIEIKTDNPVEELPADNETKQEIDRLEGEGAAAAEQHNEVIDAFNSSLPGKLEEINNSLANVDKSDELNEAEETYKDAQTNVESAADAMNNIEVKVSEDETLTFDTLDDLLAYVNAESTEPTEPDVPDVPDAPVEPEYSDNATIAAAQRAAYEAELEAWQAQRDAEKAAADEAANELTAAEAAKKAAAAQKAQDLINDYNSKVGELNDAISALNKQAQADKDALDSKISVAETAYDELQKKAGQVPGTEDENGNFVSYQDQLDQAKAELENLRQTQADLKELSEKLTAAQNANNDRKSAEQAKTNKENDIKSIKDEYGADFDAKNLTDAEAAALAAKTTVDNAVQFESDAKVLQGQKPTYDEVVSEEQLKALNAVENAKNYINGDFTNLSVDKDEDGTKGNVWLNQEIGKYGYQRQNGLASRGTILNNYLTMTPERYTTWWKNECKFDDDPFIYLTRTQAYAGAEHYDERSAGDALKKLMEMVKAAKPAEYQSALAEARSKLDNADGKTEADIIAQMNKNQQNNAGKLTAWNEAIKAFIKDHKLNTTVEQFDVDQVVKDSGTAVGTAKDNYTTAIEGLNTSLGLIAEAAKLNTSADDRANIKSKFDDLAEKQIELNNYLTDLNGENGLIAQVTNTTNDYHTKYNQYVDAVGKAQEAYDHVKSVNAAIDKAKSELEKLNLLSANKVSKPDRQRIDELNAEIGRLMDELKTAEKKADERTDDVNKAKSEADEAKGAADDALNSAKEAAAEAAEKVEETQRALDAAEEALRNALDEDARRRAEEEAERLRQELEELRQALEAMRDYDDDDDDTGVVIDEEDVPLAAGPTTRAQFVGYLWDHEGQPKAEAEDFTDVVAENDFAPAIRWARSIGIVVGDGNGNFMPDDLVTVSAVRSILTRYAAYLNIEMPELTTLAGEDGNPVFNCADVLTEFFGE